MRNRYRHLCSLAVLLCAGLCAYPSVALSPGQRSDSGQKPQAKSPSLSTAAQTWPQTRVTFQERAMQAKRLLPKLGERAGAHLECSPELAGDVLLLHVKDRPLAEVMAQLAEADSAEWVAISNGFRLRRPPVLVVKLQHQENVAREEGLRQRLKPLWESLLVRLTPDQALFALRERKKVEDIEIDDNQPGSQAKAKAREERLRRLDALHPIYRLVGRCLQAIDLSRLAAMQIGERLVYSTRPTAAQLPLARLSANTMAQFAEEDAIWRNAQRQSLRNAAGKSALSQHTEENNTQEDYQDTSASFGGSAELSQNVPLEPPTGPPDRIIVTILRGEDSDYVLKVWVLNQANEQLLELKSDDLLRSAEPYGSELNPSEETSKTRKQEATITFSPMTLLVAQAKSAHRHQVSAEMTVQPAPRVVAEWLTNPEENEPLSLAVTDAFLSTAKALEVNLAACLRDEDYSLLVDPLPVAEFVRQVKEEGKTEVRIGGDWMVVRPRYPGGDLQNRVDRRVPTTFLRSVAAEGHVDLEAYATYLAQIPEGANDHLFLWPVSLLTQNHGFQHYGDTGLLRLYGSLSPSQRERLRNGGQVNYSELNGAQRALASWTIYQGDQSSLERETRFDPPGLGDLGEEPTEIAPQGLFWQGGIRAWRTQERHIYLIDPTETGRKRIYSVIHADFPGMKVHLGHPRPAPVGGFDSLLCEVRIVTGLHVEADVCPWQRIENDYHDEPKAIGPPQTQASLPPDLRKKVEEELGFHKRQ